jgi:N-sulfoglucosamine sulfohydrolase
MWQLLAKKALTHPFTLIILGTCGCLLLAFRWPFPSALQETRPNILFLIADDAGLDMSAYGRTWVHTPAFDRIAREGMLFEKAYTPNAKCAPSRACILTGRNPWQLEAACNHVIYFPPHFKVFTEVLAENGYRTGYTGKTYAPGVTLKADGNPRAMFGQEYKTFSSNPPARHLSKNDYPSNFAAFLQEKNDQPWCFWVGFSEPHRDYEYGTGLRSGKNPKDIERVPAYWPDVDTVRTDMLDYAFEIEYMDQQVQKILAELEKQGQLDNTLIVYTSDHGMPFPRVKGNQYEAANHIPLAMMWKKGIPSAGRKVHDFTSFIDLAPTLLDVAGIRWQDSGMHPASGKSLLPLLKSSKSGQLDPSRNFVLVGQERHDIGRPKDQGYPVRGIYQGQYLYLQNYEPGRWPACNPETGYLNCDASPSKTYVLNQRRNNPQDRHFWNLCFGKRSATELYDLAKDPDCIKNLSNDPRYAALQKQLLAKLESKLRQEGDLRMQGYGHLYEQYPQAELKGFYERYMQGERPPTTWIKASDYEQLPLDER